MAEAGKGSDDKSGEPSDAPQADSEPKKSSMKATKEDGSTSGEKTKKKKKKSAEDLATHDNVGKIASEAASNRDTGTGSVKKPKGSKKSSSKEGKSDGKANATKKSSSKEGKSTGKPSAVKKGRHSKAGLETLSGSEAKDAIKGKKSRKKKKKKKHVASQLPSSPVALHPPSAPDASAQSYFAYPPATLPFPAQAPIPQPAIAQLPPANAPQTSSGLLSKIGAFLGVVERKDASQHPPADFTTASNVSTQLHPPLFLAPQSQQMPYGAFQSMSGQLAPPGGQLPMTAQQTPLVTVQPNVSLQEGYVQPNSGQPILDQNLASQQATVNHAMRGQNIDQPMPAEPIQGYTPSQSLPSQLTPGQPIPIQPDEQVQGKMVPSYSLPNQSMPTYLPKEPSLTEPMASQHMPGATASFIDQSVPTQAVVEQSVPLKPLFGRDYTGQTIVSRPMIVSRVVSTETASSEQTLDKASTHAQPPQISQGDMAQAMNLYGPQTSIQTPIRRSSILFTNTANPPGGPFVPALYRQGSRTEDSFYHSFAMAEPQVLQDRMPSSMHPKQLSSARTSVAQLPQSESTPRSSRFFAYGQIEMSRPAARRLSRSLHAADTLPRKSSWSSFSRRPSRTRDYALASPDSLSGTIDDMRPNSHEDYDVMEPVESRRDSSAKQRSSCMRLSQSTLHAETRELADDFDSTRAWRFSVGRVEPPQHAASASRPYQPWETRCAADTTQHIKYTAAVAEDLRVASLALRRLQYNNETERRRRDFLATELMKRAALASSEVRRASMALAAMYPEDAFPGDTASSMEQGGRLLSKANAKKAELPARPAAGPGGEHKAQGITSTSWREHRRMSHRGPGALPLRPANEKGRGSQSQDFLFEATSSRLADMPNARKTTSKRSLARKSSHSLDFSFQATSSGAAAMPGVRKAKSKKSLARKSSRASLTTDAESSSHGDSGCDMCGGLWRGLVREAPSKESSTTQCEDVVLELGGHVTSPLTWPLDCPGGRKRSSVATVTMLGAVRRGSRRSEQPKQAVSDEQVTAVLLEDVQASPLECFQGVSHDIVASIAGKGDAQRKSLKVGEQVGTVDENALNRMMRDSSVGVPAEHLEREGEDQGQPAADGQEDDGPYHPMEGGRLPLDEEANVEAEMWKFAESTVPLFPESAVAVLFLLACLVWVAVVLFAGSAHHSWLNTTTVHEAKTGRPEGSPPTSPPNEPPTALQAPTTASSAGPPTASPSSDWLVCDSALCQREARRLSTLLEGEPCRNFYDYACQRLDETPPLPKRGTASSTDTRLADELDDALVGYVRDATHSDVAPARQLLQACGTGSARDLADFVATYVQPSWPASDATSDVAVWEAAGRLLRELNVAALVSVVPVVKSPTAVALGPAQLLLMPGDDASQAQLLSDAVRATVTFVSTAADARTVAEDVVKILSDLSKIQDAAMSAPGLLYDTLPLSNLSAGVAALVRSATSSSAVAPSSVLVLPGVDLKSLSKLVSSDALRVLHYVGFRAALWAAPFVATPPDKLITAHMLTRRPPIADRQRACSRAVGHAVPLVYLQAMRGALGTLHVARMWTDQLEDRFLRSLPRLLPQPGPDAHLVANSVRHTPLARFYPARLADANSWNAYLLALAASMANTTGQRNSTLLKVRMAAAAADRSGGWAFDMRPTWLPGGALRLPPGLFGSVVPLNNSLRTHQVARVTVRLYSALAALLRDIPGVFDSPVRESEQTNLRSVAECLRNDLDTMPPALKSGFPPAKDQPWALFDQAVGLALAHDNLVDLLDTRRIWGKDLRLKGLENLSSDQLFFVYYAMDNCQRSDAQAQRRLPWPLGGQERVNGPLRHWAPFAEHFGCRVGQPMVPPKRCSLLEAS